MMVTSEKPKPIINIVKCSENIEEDNEQVRKSLSSSPASSTRSISDLLEKDNWTSRQKYFAEDDESSVSSKASSGSLIINHKTIGDESQIELAELDRFGFISLTSPSLASNLKAQEREREQEEKRKKKLDEREDRRSMKWLEMLAKLEGKPVREWPDHHSKFTSRLAKGIPDCIRCQLWPVLASHIGCNAGSIADVKYKELYLRISGFERQIDLDIERTLRDHVMFKIRFSAAQISLFKILVAYSNHDKEVGYCQGMSTIAAFLLLYLPEEEAFQALTNVMATCRLMFTPHFPLLFQTFYIQERLMQKYLPRLEKHLHVHLGIAPSIYATKWYLTLFLGFPFPMATRIWDIFLFYGFDVLVCVAVAILRVSEDRLLSLEYEPAMHALSRLPEEHCFNPSQIIRMAVRLYNDCQSHERHREFKKYRDEYALKQQNA